MDALTRYFRTFAVSLAMLLTIIDLTDAFTVRYEFVRPYDLAAAETSFPAGAREPAPRVATDEYSVAPVQPAAAQALPLVLTAAAEPTQQRDKDTDRIDFLASASNESASDLADTTVILNDQVADSMSNVDNDTDTSKYDEVTTMPAKELKRVYNTSPTLITQKEFPTVTTTVDVTNVHIDESASKDEDVNKKTIVTTTMSPNIEETLKKSNNTVDTKTESTSNSSVETTPSWKKYTKIERTPGNITDNVEPLKRERLGDSLNAHTTVSRVSLEKAFDLAPHILSLQELRTHLIDSTNSIPTSTDLLKINDVTKTNAKSGQSVTKGEAISEIYPTEMVSLRAGYLNHTNPLVDTEIPISGNGTEAGEVELEGVAYETDLHDDNDDIHNLTSHSQMVEDALKEEFLKEQRLDDSVHLTTPVFGGRNYAETNEVTDSPQIMQADQTIEQKQDLTVKPINTDKKTLYTVSPNYKPLKKIDVQPMKPFMRDPDDNSWRNESLSSRGIVFKGKNSSKAFTEVLKNKTDIVMSNIAEQEKAIEKVVLRDRLEKIAEKRKSKKKKIDKFGNTEYSDYEENNSGDTHSSKEKPSDIPEISSTTSTPPPVLTKTVEWISKGSILEDESPDTGSQKPPKTTTHNYGARDYYDSKDDDADYATFPNIDILKSTPRPRVQWPVTQQILDNTKPLRPLLPDRQPTVQYFPPRPKVIDDKVKKYDDDNKSKYNIYGHSIEPKAPIEPIQTYTERNYPGKYPTQKYIPENRGRATNEVKQPPTEPIHHVEYRPVEDDGRAFVIRHYKDLLESIIKDADYDRNANPYTAPAEEGRVKSEEYDYGRKEDLNRFVDNFNQNHERFKADFPILFNTSIVHGSESGKVLASSSAMFKRLYNNGVAPEPFAFSNKPFDPNCENITVELAPAYELHYYVPDQEETGDHTMPYGYRT